MPDPPALPGPMPGPLRIWLRVKNGYPKMGHPGKWKHGQKPAAPWWFNFDPSITCLPLKLSKPEQAMSLTLEHALVERSQLGCLPKAHVTSAGPTWQSSFPRRRLKQDREAPSCNGHAARLTCWQWMKHPQVQKASLKRNVQENQQ